MYIYFFYNYGSFVIKYGMINLELPNLIIEKY